MSDVVMRIRTGAVAAALLFGVAAKAGPAQQTPPTFRSGVNTVEVYATVTDRTGRLVPNLAETDFEILDNGKAQPITVFDRGTQAITIAIMLDESPSLFDVSDRVTSGVQAFARNLLPGDRAVLGAFSHVVRLNPEFTANVAKLLERFPLGRPRFPAGTAMWDGLDAAAAALESERGRRVTLVLTDADDNCSEVDPRQVVARIERQGTMVYAIGVKGDSGLPVADLKNLTRDSGGYFFELKPSDDIASTFARVADELHRQYLIGFSAASLDGKSHQITLRAKAPGLTVRARRTYVAPKAGGGL